MYNVIHLIHIEATHRHMETSNMVELLMPLFSHWIQRFCSCCGFQDRNPGAAALYRGLGEVDIPRPSAPGGPGAQPVHHTAHHRLHQTVSLFPRSQRVHWTGRGAWAPGDWRRAARAAGVLFPDRWSAQARHLPPVQPAEWWTLEQAHDGLLIWAAGQPECCTQPGPQRASEWADPLKL